MKKPSWQLDFDCKACGACCRAIACPLLDDATNLCTVYESRPAFCRVGFYRPSDVPVDEYIKKTHEACKALEAQYGQS